MSAAALLAAALVLRELGGIIESWPEGDLGGDALRYGQGGYEVFPLRGKVPAIAKRDGGNGVLDATTDLMQIAAWWTKYPNANIGGRVPAGVVVVDIDPRSGGLETWTGLVAAYGDAPTRAAWSGRGDGGQHLYYRHPGGKIRSTIGAGIDVKTSHGYTVLPPSLHPDTGEPYRWDDVTIPIVAAPSWLTHLLRQPVSTPRIASTARPSNYDGDSIADWYTATHTWADVLNPHGWHLASGSGDDDGSQWRHPAASHAWSATVTHGCLFVYSPNTPFAVTEEGGPRGYTKFRAFATLDHRGDLSAAARAARTTKDVAA